MTLAPGEEKVTVADTSKIVKVADNTYANLMYYLHCIQDCSTLEFGKLADHAHYASLTKTERRSMVDICCKLTPTLMMKNGLFVHTERMEENNKFIEIKHEKNEVAAADENVVIGVYRCRITQKMLFTRLWIKETYYKPMNEAKQMMPSIDYRMTHTIPFDAANLDGCDKANYYLCCEFCTCADDVECCNSFVNCFSCSKVKECGSIVLIVACFFLPALAVLMFIAGLLAKNAFVRAASFWSGLVGVIAYLYIYFK